MITHKLSIVCLLVFWISQNVSANSSLMWDAFLENPNNDTLMMLEKEITESARDCKPNLIPFQVQQTSLNELINIGNKYAFHAGLLILDCLDGGELEDFYRVSGTFFELQPWNFLHIIKEDKISDTQLKYMLTMLPLSTVDNIDLKISIVEERIKIMNNLTDESLTDTKEKAIFYLEHARKHLINIRSNIQKE